MADIVGLMFESKRRDYLVRGVMPMAILLAEIMFSAATSVPRPSGATCNRMRPEWLQQICTADELINLKGDSNLRFGDHQLSELTNIQHSVLAKRPLIKVFNDCLSHMEIKQLLALASKRLTEDTDSGFSSSLYLRSPSDAGVPILRHIARLAGHLSGLPWKLAEPVSLTKYITFQSYGLHYDSGFMMQGKIMNRAATFLVYLNDVPKGGETVFPYATNKNTDESSVFESAPEEKPELHEICRNESTLKVTPKAGNCLVFYNNLSDGGRDGGRDPLSMHGSCPVEQGDKWIAQIWLHDAPWGQGVTDFWS